MRRGGGWKSPVLVKIFFIPNDRILKLAGVKKEH